MLRFLMVFLLFASPLMGGEAEPVAILRELIDPARIDGLEGERAANPRLRKMVYWLEVARRSGKSPEEVVLAAQRAAGYAGTARAEADRASLVRNRTILERLGCLDEAGMEALRRGKAPVVTRGPYKGDIASVDHIIPRSVVEELDERIYNLEFMPRRLNSRKGALVGDRQRQLAATWNRAGLLSDAGLKAVVNHPG